LVRKRGFSIRFQLECWGKWCAWYGVIRVNEEKDIQSSKDSQVYDTGLQFDIDAMDDTASGGGGRSLCVVDDRLDRTKQLIITDSTWPPMNVQYMASLALRYSTIPHWLKIITWKTLFPHKFLFASPLDILISLSVLSFVSHVTCWTSLFVF
jgi:hypothetical protein